MYDDERKKKIKEEIVSFLKLLGWEDAENADELLLSAFDDIWFHLLKKGLVDPRHQETAFHALQLQYLAAKRGI